MKKIMSLILVCLMLVPTFVFAEEPIRQTSLKVYFDGQEIVFPDEQPFTNIETPMPDGTTYKANDDRVVFIPIRAISEAVGYEVLWDNDTETVTVQKDDRVTTFKLGGACYVNGKAGGCVVNFPMKNDRVFVSQYGICYALDCTMRWDDINRAIYFFSNEKYPDKADITQNKFVKTDMKYDELSEFNSMSETSFVLPGLQEGFVPQGIAYRKDKNQFLISGYNDISYSYIAVIDGATGKLSAHYRILNTNDKMYTGHMGGIAVDSKNIYFSNGTIIERISLLNLDSTPSGGYLKIEEKIKINLGYDAYNSFCEESGGYLWTGNYYQPSKKKYANKSHEDYPMTIRAYKLDATQQSGFAAEFKVENEKYDYVPEFVYTLENDQCIQGMTLTGNYLITAVSNGTKASILRVYDISKAESNGTIKLGENKEVPVLNLKVEKTVNVPAYIEELSVADGYIYTIYESCVQKFRNNKLISDCAWKTDLSKLLTIE